MTNRNDLIGILAFIAVVTVIFTAVGLSTADGVAGEGDTSVPYEVAGQTLTITGDITSADVINIDDATWAGLTTVVVKDTVTSIADNSLSKATAVTKITVPVSFKDSMAKIFGTGYDKATVEYKDADGKIDLYIGRSVTQIDRTYYKNANLKSVFIPSEVESMMISQWGQGVFSSCTALKTVTFEKGSKITSITDYAFRGCTSLETVIIPDGLKSIISFAFNGCTALKNVYPASSDVKEGVIFPSGFTTFSNSVFKGCTSIESVVIPDSATDCSKDSVFSGCTSLKTVKLPNTITKIGQYWFEKDISLESITIPESVTVIGNYAFSECTSLKEIKFTGSVPEKIGAYAFSDCGKLETQIIAKIVIVSSDTQIKTRNALLNASPVEGGKYTVPEGVEVISATAYKCRTDMIEITIPSSVKEIEAEAFSNCSELKTVNGLTSSMEIGLKAFAGTPLKEAIILNNKLIYVPNTPAFENYVVPESVCAVESYAFAENKCVKTVKFEGTMLGESPMSLGTSIFYNCENLASVELPKGLTFIYTAMFNGCKSLETFEIPSTVTYIYAQAFMNSGLKEITIPSSVLTLEAAVFSKCASLTKVVFENPNTQFVAQTVNGPVAAANMFSYCSKLTEVTLPAKLDKIPGSTFTGCSSLTSIDIPTTVTEIGSGAFQSSGITELKIHEGVMLIDSNAFRLCTKLASIEIPTTCYPQTKSGGSTKGGVMNSAFSKIGTEVEGGTTVIIHGNTYIGNGAFGNCNIKELCIDGSPSINNVAFTGAKIGKIVITGGVGFDCSTVNIIKGTIADGVLPVYIKNGEEYVSGSMLVSNSATDKTLTIGKDVVAISPSVLDKKGLTSITVDAENKYFTVKDGALYFESNNTKADELEDATLVTVLKGTGETAITDFVIPEGTAKIAPYAFRGTTTSLDTVTVAKSVKYLDGYSLTNIKAILIASKDSAPNYDAYVTGSSSVLYFPSDASADISEKIAEKCMYNSKVSSLKFGGYYLKDGDNTIVVMITEGSVKAVSMTGEDAEKKVNITLNDSFSQSLETIVAKEGWYAYQATEVAKNEDGTYTVKFDTAKSKMLIVSGVSINEYKITVAEDPSYGVTYSVIDPENVAYGTEVRFRVTLSDGYNGTPAVKIGEETITATDGVYTITVTSDVTVVITGITPEGTYTVSFDSDGGSAVTSQTVTKGYTVAFPANPTNGDKVFFGWYNGDSLYDFASAVTDNVSLKAKWISAEAEKVKITLKADNGTITARSLNDNSIVTDTVYKGTTVSFVFVSKNMGYEVLSWTVGTETDSTNSAVKTVTVDKDTEISVSSVYSVSSYPYLETDIKAPVKGDTYKMVWKVNGTKGFNNMVFTPSVLGEYVYAWSGSEIYKISIYDGTVVKKVDTGFATGGLYYNLVTVGNGYVLAGYAGQVYDADLNPVFQLYYDDETRANEVKAYYNDGYFYMFTEENVYKFKATDADSTTNNKQLPDATGTTKYKHYISYYQGQSNLIFTDKYIIGLENSGDQTQNRHAVTYDIETLDVIDSYEFTELKTANLNTGYISYYNGVFYFNTYSPFSNMFSTSNEDWISLGTIEIDENGKFDPITVHYYDLGTTSYVSSFIVVGDYGYVNAGSTFKVYDIKTMECVKSISSTMSHGNMAVSVQGNVVTAYIIPYTTMTTLYAFQHDQSKGTLTNVSLNNVLDTKEYSSQIVHFGPNGELIYYNDSGYLFCIQFGYKATFDVSDGVSVKDVSFYADEGVSALPTTTKTWYKFDGWYTTSDFTGTKVTEILKGDVGNRTYYAKFVALTSEDLVNGIQVSAFADNGKKALFQIESGKNVTSVSVVVGYSAYVTVAEGTFLCPTFTETFVTDVTNGVVDFTNKDGVRMESVSVFCCYEFDSLAYSTTITSEFVPVMSSAAEITADEGVTLMFDGAAVADGQTVAFGTYTVTVMGDESAAYSVNGTAVGDGVKLFYSGQKLTVSKI